MAPQSISASNGVEGNVSISKFTVRCFVLLPMAMNKSIKSVGIMTAKVEAVSHRGASLISVGAHFLKNGPWGDWDSSECDDLLLHSTSNAHFSLCILIP